MLKISETIPIAAITKLVEYLYYDEEKDCEDDDGNFAVNHIFHSVKTVADWLDAVRALETGHTLQCPLGGGPWIFLPEWGAASGCDDQGNPVCTCK